MNKFKFYIVAAVLASGMTLTSCGDKKINGKHTGLFAAGLLLGTAGVKILSSKDAKNVYTKCTAAVLRAKESVMKTVTTVQENAGDIYAEAQQINEDRKAQETSYADESQTEE